jgi:outer membrane lipoprotein SlyB
MPIAGKKIPVDNIIAVARPDEKKMKGRENRAIAATAGRFLGTAIGGDAGDVVYWGSVAGNVTSDFISREKLKTQRIKCEILEF